MSIFLSPKASRTRQKEAEDARNNRLEIVAARSQGQVTRRELFKWGIFSGSGLLVNQSGLSPFAKSAFADIPTGTPLSPVGHNQAEAFKTPLLRLNNLTHHTLNKAGSGDATTLEWTSGLDHQGIDLSPGEQFSTRLSNDVKITHKVNLPREGGVKSRDWPNPGLVGPAEGRPPGAYFGHQRWAELTNPAAGGSAVFPVKGVVMSHGQIGAGVSYNLAAGWPTQDPNAVWTFGEGRFVEGGFNANGQLTFPNLLQMRYGEPVIFRNYNNLPFDPARNGGFGRNEPTTHNHNGHNGAESDGAGNAHFFPGEYYDYLYSTMLARRDAGLKMSDGRDLDATMGIKRGDARASGPTNTGDIELVPGDFREIQGTLWFHDHRISFTSENVHKGYAALMEYFSGPDRGYERPGLSTTKHNGKSAEDVNLRLPSGWRNGKTWGNRDFDVYLAIQDVAFDADGQLFFDVFDTDGFLGDVMHVNYQWKPTMKVLPRKYRFRTLSAGMSRWIQLAVATSKNAADAKPVPLTMIANDGNIFPKFVRNLPQLNIQATAERYDFIVDFSSFPVGKKLYLVNLLEFSNGRKPDKTLTLAEALSGQSADPVPGAIMEFEIASSVPSIDKPGEVNTIANACGANDTSLVNDPGADWQIPEVAPVRTRTIELVRGADDGGLPFDHPEGPEPWAVRVNGGSAHGADMRRASNLPRPGDVEHWVLKSGGGWGHPLHLHFEEAITLSRNGKRDPRSIHPGEFMKRKDMWHIGAVGSQGEGGEPTIQVAFGEFGGAYVNHCHNTVHEDNAMLIHYHLAKQGVAGSGIPEIHATVLPTPDPRVTGVSYVQSCFLEEGNPPDQGFDPTVGAQPDDGGRTVVQCPPEALGPVKGAQGEPPAGYIDLSGFTI